MHRGRFVGIAVTALVTVSAWAGTLGATPAAAGPSYTLTDVDFTLQEPALAPVDWQTNGTAGLTLNPSDPVPISLALTHNLAAGGEGGTAWSLLKAQVPSFTMWADVNIYWTGDITKSCPADGFAMAFANTSPSEVAGTGGSLALVGDNTGNPQFIGFEVNLWRDQALVDRTICTTNKFTTFAFEDVNSKATNVRNAGQTGTPAAGGAKIAQVTLPSGLTILNGGWYRYQWDVDSTTGHMDVYVTGLDAGNSSVQHMLLTEVTMGAKAPPLSFPGRWGVTAGTGGAISGVNVGRIRVVSPMVAAPAPAAPAPAPAGGTTPPA